MVVAVDGKRVVVVVVNGKRVVVLAVNGRRVVVVAEMSWLVGWLLVLEVEKGSRHLRITRVAQHRTSVGEHHAQNRDQDQDQCECVHVVPVQCDGSGWSVVAPVTLVTHVAANAAVQ